MSNTIIENEIDSLRKHFNIELSEKTFENVKLMCAHNCKEYYNPKSILGMRYALQNTIEYCKQLERKILSIEETA